MAAKDGSENSGSSAVHLFYLYSKPFRTSIDQSSISPPNISTKSTVQVMRMAQMIVESNYLHYHWPDRTISILITEYTKIDFNQQGKTWRNNQLLHLSQCSKDFSLGQVNMSRETSFKTAGS